MAVVFEAIQKIGFWSNKPEAYQDQGGAEPQVPLKRDILKYVGDLKQSTNPVQSGKIGPRNFFEIASNEKMKAGEA